MKHESDIFADDPGKIRFSMHNEIQSNLDPFYIRMAINELRNPVFASIMNASQPIKINTKLNHENLGH